MAGWRCRPAHQRGLRRQRGWHGDGDRLHKHHHRDHRHGPKFVRSDHRDQRVRSTEPEQQRRGERYSARYRHSGSGIERHRHQWRLIANASTRGVDINATSADIDIGTSISATATGRTVEVTSTSGSKAINFSGAITDPGLGINLDTNTGTTIGFSGGLNIDSTTNTGFNATGGGTVSVTGAGNSISSVNATALNVANTTIGAQRSDVPRHLSGNNEQRRPGQRHRTQQHRHERRPDRHRRSGSTVNASGGIIQNTTGDRHTC